MNKSTRIPAVLLLVFVCGALAWLLAPGDGADRRESLALGAAESPDEPPAAPVVEAGSEGRLAAGATLEASRGAAPAERAAVPDQMDLRRELAAAETRHLEAMEAAFAALRETRGHGCIEGWRDESGELRLDAPAPPQPCLVRVYDLPADPVEPAADPSAKGASVAPPRARVLAVHLTQANAPQVFAAQAEAERLRRRLR